MGDRCGSASAGKRPALASDAMPDRLADPAASAAPRGAMTGEREIALIVTTGTSRANGEGRQA